MLSGRMVFLRYILLLLAGLLFSGANSLAGCIAAEAQGADCAAGAAGDCSPKAIAFYEDRIAFFEGKDAYTDQQLDSACSNDPQGAVCMAWVSDALCAAELSSTSFCGGTPLGNARWGYFNDQTYAEIAQYRLQTGRNPGPELYQDSHSIYSYRLSAFDLLDKHPEAVEAVRQAQAISLAVGLVGGVRASRIPSGRAVNAKPADVPTNLSWTPSSVRNIFPGVGNRIPIETSNGALVRPADNPNYSVATEVQLPTSAYPGVSRQRHNQISNQALHEAFEADPAYAAQMESLYPGIVDGVRPGPRGAFPRSAPTSDVTWHHGTQPGQMQLVPIDQHTAPGPVQGSLHPNGSGGFADWGTE
jgi:hypothetical protein